MVGVHGERDAKMDGCSLPPPGGMSILDRNHRHRTRLLRLQAKLLEGPDGRPKSSLPSSPDGEAGGLVEADTLVAAFRTRKKG